jgi:two-component system, OmpR family, phosphate regulon sensor histidine kinase PhoR
MNRTVQIVAAIVVASIIASIIWSPWIAVVTLALIVAGFAYSWSLQHRHVAELLRDPAAQNLSFDQAVTSLRTRLKEGEQVVRDRDAEIAQRRQITNAIPDGLFLLDHENRIVWCNQAALVMHSLDAFRDIGKPISQLIRQPEFLSYLQDDTQPEPMLQVGAKTFSFKLQSAVDGARLLLTRDVTERERLDRMRRDFVANVSHEMRTPLTVVGGYVETLTELPLSKDDERRYLNMIGTQTGNLRRLVEDLLTLARLENDLLPAENGLIDLAGVAREALSDAKILSAGSHQFDAEINSATLRGSASELRSAVGNLLSNAVRYTPAGGKIFIRVGRDSDSSTLVEVRDTGVGVAAEHIPRLTERFYRVDRSRSRETGGTGLGLAIVKHVAQRHHAKLEIESTVGQGSTFRLRFSQ